MGNQQIDYDKKRLLVWADWGSSGIWHPQVGSKSGDGPVRMVNHKDIKLPAWLSERFDQWVASYDDYAPDRPDAFEWKKFKDAGQILAFELARFVEDEYQVEYAGLQVFAFP